MPCSSDVLFLSAPISWRPKPLSDHLQRKSIPLKKFVEELCPYMTHMRTNLFTMQKYTVT